MDYHGYSKIPVTVRSLGPDYDALGSRRVLPTKSRTGLLMHRPL